MIWGTSQKSPARHLRKDDVSSRTKSITARTCSESARITKEGTKEKMPVAKKISRNPHETDSRTNCRKARSLPTVDALSCLRCHGYHVASPTRRRFSGLKHMTIIADVFMLPVLLFTLRAFAVTTRCFKVNSTRHHCISTFARLAQNHFCICRQVDRAAELHRARVLSNLRQCSLSFIFSVWSK